MVAKKPLESGLQNSSKTVDFHTQNQPGRNPEFSAGRLCPVFTRISAVPELRTQVQYPAR